MGTSFEEIYDIFMTTITDYKLDNLYISNKEVFMEYLKSFIAKGALEVSEDLLTSLDYESVEENIGTEDVQVLVKRWYFTNNLLPLEKLIFVQFMVIYWYEKQTEDILAITARIGNNSERDANDKNNLKLKRERINMLRADNYANIDRLQASHLEEFGWGDF